MGMQMARHAKEAFEEGLQYDPYNQELKRGVDEAAQRLLQELLSGEGRQRLALPAPGRQERISLLPHSTPLHMVHCRDLLPVQLLTPFQARLLLPGRPPLACCCFAVCGFLQKHATAELAGRPRAYPPPSVAAARCRQAENDHHVKDTYNYMTIAADVRLPERHIGYLQDRSRIAAFDAAIRRACGVVQARDCDARVLHVGSGAGLLTMIALRHGAHHVTCLERWLYLALATKESLQRNAFPEEAAAVVYKRPTDAALGADVRCACNVLLLDGILDDGFMASGLFPAVRHAVARLLLPDAEIVPSAATVYVQAVQMRTSHAAGFDCSAANAQRWHPAHACGGGAPAPGAYVALSPPTVAWHFDFRQLPEAAESRLLEVPFTVDGAWNAVLFWYDLHMGGGECCSTGPDGGMTSLRPALQYLPGELAVEAGRTAALRCSHNTVRLHFMLDEAEYTHLAKPDASFPPHQLAMLADAPRLRYYDAAITRQVRRLKALSATGAGLGAEDPGVHVLDIGTGCGAVLAMMAARAGADSVVAAELHAGVAAAARRVVAANGLSSRVSVVQRDCALLQRGTEVRQRGVNMVVLDFFDAGLFGDQARPPLSMGRAPNRPS